jgi:hypothetical protein
MENKAQLSVAYNEDMCCFFVTHSLLPAKSVEQNSSWEGNSHSTMEGALHLLWNQKAQCHAHRRPCVTNSIQFITSNYKNTIGHSQRNT